MLTPQDIQDKKLAKAAFGGYDMATVDDFLDQVSEDYSTLYKESAVLKSKLKVLVDKVEEYRSTEDSMRMALLTAQKMADEILAEAKTKAESLTKESTTQAEEIVAAANAEAQRRGMELSQKVALEEARLKEAERRTSLFRTRVSDIIDEQRTFLEQLENFVPATTPATTPPSPKTVVVTPKPAPTPVVPNLAAQKDLPIYESDASVGAYLAEEVRRMTVDPNSPPPSVQDPYDSATSDADAAFLKMFDQGTSPETEQSAPIKGPDTRAEEKIDIARSISSALGDSKDIKGDPNTFWDDEGEPTTKRPKFDFDDLQFGKNLQEDVPEE